MASAFSSAVHALILCPAPQAGRAGKCEVHGFKVMALWAIGISDCSLCERC
jgi:hypothetical protein